MSFVRLVRTEMQGSLPRLAFMSVLAGASTAAILASVNSGAHAVEAGKPDILSALLFLVALLLFVKSQHYVLIVTTAESEAVVHRIRVRLLDEVRQAELRTLEDIGRAEIVAAVTEDAATLTQAANVLAFAAQGVVLIVFVAFYVAYLSIEAFFLSVLVIGIAMAIYHAKSAERAEEMREASQRQRRLIELTTDLLDGFKEVRLNSLRSSDLADAIRDISRQAANLKIRAQSESYKQMVLIQTMMYVLLGAIVFVVPALSETVDSASITKNTMAVFFVIGACFGLLQSVSMVAAADAAANHLELLEGRLKAGIVSPPVTPSAAPAFRKLAMRAMTFQYPERSGDPGFTIGPIDFELDAGEVVVIIGGNGSGKSTFLKVLAGLYSPTAGAVVIDGVDITDKNREDHRALITAVFSDHHLFRHLLGIHDADSENVGRLLQTFELASKTQLVDGDFNTLDLSGGQRRRLALVVGLLERRPLLLLDEWTANQDPEFRRKFYDEILPSLKQAGLTIVIVSHDDQRVQDLTFPARQLRMDRGRFQ